MGLELEHNINLHEALVDEFTALEKAISERKDTMKFAEAKMFYDYLSSLRVRLEANHIEMDNILEKPCDFQQRSKKVSGDLLKVFLMQVELKNRLESLETNSNIDKMVEIQKSLIEGIESLETKILKGPSSYSLSEYEIYYGHLMELWNNFTVNQAKIENIIGEDDINNQLAISRKIRDKVIKVQVWKKYCR